MSDQANVMALVEKIADCARHHDPVELDELSADLDGYELDDTDRGSFENLISAVGDLLDQVDLNQE